MQTSPSGPKHERKVVQSDSPIPEEASFANVLGNTIPNANWGVEPNFNLNFNMTSPNNPRTATANLRSQGGNKKPNGDKGSGKPGTKGDVTSVTGKSMSTLTTTETSSREKNDPLQQKSKIPALCRSQTAEALMNSRADQRLKSPNLKQTSVPIPKTHAHNNMAVSPKSCQSVSPKGQSNIISPKLASQTPKLPKLDPATTSTKSGEQANRDPRDKTVQQSSVSPKQSAQRKPTGTKNTTLLGSKEYLDGKDSNAGCGSKTSSKSSSNSKATTVTKDSLDSKTSPDTKSTMGSGDSLDSNSHIASKTSLGSKDSLDSKNGSNSTVSPYSKSRMGSRDSLDSKPATKIKASAGSLDSKAPVDLKSGTASKDELDPKAQTPSESKISFNLTTSPGFKPDSELNLVTSSNAISNSKPGLTQSTSKPTLMPSGSKTELVRSISPPPSKSLLSESKDDNLNPQGSCTEPSPDTYKAVSDSSKTVMVQSSSRSALEDLSSHLAPPPGPGPASRSPGSDPSNYLHTP